MYAYDMICRYLKSVYLSLLHSFRDRACPFVADLSPSFRELGFRFRGDYPF